VAFVGAVGDDAAGSRVLHEASQAGVDVGHTKVIAGVPTGRALITVADDGDNTIVVVPGANHHVAATVPASRVLLAQLEVPIPTVTAAFTTAHHETVTVLNPAPAARLPTKLVAATDLMVPNQHEAALLGGEEELLRQGVHAVVTTLGADGAAVFRTVADGTPERREFRPPTVTPVDTTGAGDAFCGVLARRLAGGTPLDDALDWALAGGALATTVEGAVPSLPTAAAIDELLSSPG
jgi:ribokinase